MPKSLTDKMEAHRLLIFNSKDVTIAPLLNDIGIDQAYIGAGETLYNETASLVTQQQKEYQEQGLAYDNFYLGKDQVEENFKRTLKLVKIFARKDSDLQDRLGLNKSFPHAIEVWIERAIQFYNSLLNETAFLTTVAKFKLTRESISAQKIAVENLRELRNLAVIEKGEAQEATRLRNEKLEALDDYSLELKEIAKIALESKPQLLEKLGVVVR